MSLEPFEQARMDQATQVVRDVVTAQAAGDEDRVVDVLAGCDVEMLRIVILFLLKGAEIDVTEDPDDPVMPPLD